MEMKCIFGIFCAWLFLNIGETDGRDMFPRITEPKNNTLLQVKPGSDIALYCSADLGDNVTAEYTIIYWMINGNFTDYFAKAQENNSTKTRKGNCTQISSVLHLYDVAAEFYNVPIICVLQTAGENDASTLYLTPPSGYWTVIIISGILTVLGLSVLSVFACMQYRAVINAAD